MYSHSSFTMETLLVKEEVGGPEDEIPIEECSVEIPLNVANVRCVFCLSDTATGTHSLRNRKCRQAGVPDMARWLIGDAQYESLMSTNSEIPRDKGACICRTCFSKLHKAHEFMIDSVACVSRYLKGTAFCTKQTTRPSRSPDETTTCGSASIPGLTSSNVNAITSTVSDGPPCKKVKHESENSNSSTDTNTNNAIYNSGSPGITASTHTFQTKDSKIYTSSSAVDDAKGQTFAVFRFLLKGEEFPVDAKAEEPVEAVPSDVLSEEVTEEVEVQLDLGESDQNLLNTQALTDKN